MTEKVHHLAGRPSNNTKPDELKKTASFNIRTTEEKRQELIAIAEKDGKKVSALITEAIDCYLISKKIN